MIDESIDLASDSGRGDLELLSLQLGREDCQTLTAARPAGLDQTVQGKEKAHLL